MIDLNTLHLTINVLTYLLAGAIIAVVGALAFVSFRGSPMRAKAYVMQKRNNVYYVIGKRKISLTQNTFKFQGREFRIDPNAVAVIDKQPILYYDLESSEPLKSALQIVEFAPSSTLVNIFYGNELLKQAFAGLSGKPKTDIFIVVMSLSLGVVLGFVIGLLYAPHMIHTAVSNSTTVAKVVLIGISK